MASEDVGIDYGRICGLNRDHATGIHYGVIAQNSIGLDCTDRFEYDYGDPHCSKCGCKVESSDSVGEDIRAYEWFDGEDYIGWTCEGEGYSLTDCLGTCILVLKSPYYTYGRFCSPCVPGAVDLDAPMDGGIKAYCLGPDWFDEYSPMPYRCFRVSDDTEVKSDDTEVK